MKWNRRCSNLKYDEIDFVLLSHCHQLRPNWDSQSMRFPLKVHYFVVADSGCC